jgi:outer membrane immunogenic protein
VKRLATAIAAIALIGTTPAFAADMAVKAPPPAPAPIYSWTGFYVGANVGGSWGNSDNSWNILAPSNITLPPSGTTCAPAGAALCVTGTDSNHLNGVLGGLQAGYNWQTGNYLFGEEIDFDDSGQRESQTFTSVGPGGGDFDVTAASMSAAYTEKLEWLGTLRGRIGFIFDRLLFYGTGGLAYGEVKTNGSAAIGGAPIPEFPVCGATCPLGNWSHNVTRTGWTVGGGVEGVLAYNWTWKIEYLCVDLGTLNTTFATLPGCFGNSGACSPYSAGTATISSRITDNIVRVGLNIRRDPPRLVF